MDLKCDDGRGEVTARSTSLEGLVEGDGAAGSWVAASCNASGRATEIVGGGVPKDQ